MLTGDKEHDQQEYLRLYRHEMAEQSFASWTGDGERFTRALAAAKNYLRMLLVLGLAEAACA